MSKSKHQAAVKAALITAGGFIAAAVITVGLGFLLGWFKSSVDHAASNRAAACTSTRTAVKDEVDALTALLGSLTIKDAGTANARATRIDGGRWQTAASAETAASGELAAAATQLKAAGTSVDPAVEGRVTDLAPLILRLPGEVKARTAGDGQDVRQLSDDLAHFQNNIAPAICSGVNIPNA